MVPPANAEGCADQGLGLARSSAQPDKDVGHWEGSPRGWGHQRGLPERLASASQERGGQSRGALPPLVLAEPNW